MPVSTTSLKFKQTIRVPRAEVYRAFTHSLALRDWLCDQGRVETHVGGPLYLQWNDGYVMTGKYLALIPGEKINFTWHGSSEPEETRVQVTLVEKDGGTLVTLVHSGIGSGKKWAGVREEFKRGWEIGLENLQSVLESGIDLRVVRRPRLGIWFDYLTPETVERLHLPVKEGVPLMGTGEGTGARAAGLEKDDVIVRMDGVKINSPESFNPVLQKHQAGDKVPVVFYREGKKKQVKVELSSRPVPAVPATAAELAEQYREKAAHSNAALAEQLQDVGEEEAEYRPAHDEWNAKEIVAHLIACERDYQSWVADMVNDNTVGESLEMRPNVTPRLEAMVRRVGTLAALRTELDHAQNETHDFLAALPAAFVARKHMYRRAAAWALEVTPTHFPDEHGEQLKKTLEAAREAKAD